MVVADRETYSGDIGFLADRGVDVVVLDDPACRALLRRFIEERPALWNDVVAGDRGR
ncbi:MAG: hypothetical protein WD044_05915 [Dongiaceae bacterium]